MSWSGACWFTVRNLWKLFICPETLEDTVVSVLASFAVYECFELWQALAVVRLAKLTQG